MPQKVHAAGCMVNSLSTNITAQYRGLWITDALLAEAFRSFCRHSPRRYGSNVPGPLEARRRASKRKNTNLAFVGGGQPVYDPSVMLGSASKDQWWKNVENKSAKQARNVDSRQDQELGLETTQLLPSWLFRTPTTKQPPFDDVHQPERHRVKPPRLKQKDLKSMEAQFKARIARATELGSILSTIENLQINLRQHPNLSEYAFSHMIDKFSLRSNYDELAPALLNPLLHPPGSSNHLAFLQHLASHQITRKSWETAILPAILKATELGLIATQDLPKLLQLIPEIHHESSSPRTTNKVHAEWHKMLIVIEQSRVLSLENLDHNSLTLWYRQIWASVQSDTAFLLLWKLRDYSGHSELGLASEITIRRLKQFAETNHDASRNLTHWISDLAVELRAPTVIQVTFKLISSAQSGEALAYEALSTWSSMLPQLCSHDLLNLSINKAAWLKASVISCNLQPEQQLLAMVWLFSRLWAENLSAAIHFANTRLAEEFESTFANIRNMGELDHLSRVVLTLDSLPLPEKDQILPFLQHFSDENLLKILGYKEHLTSLAACLKLEYAQFRDNNFTMRARCSTPQIVQYLAESINKDLPRFQAMAQTLVLKSNENFRIVRRLLNFNMRLKFAMSQSWSSTVTRRHSDQRHNNQPDLDPNLVLNTIEKLAMTFAVTPVISPRSSFKQVYKMYLFLHKHGAPINPIIGRALWHAGVTRYGQVGAPKTQVLWCLSKVRELEGVEVANRLLWSAGFRKKFLREYVRSVVEDPILSRSLKLPRRDGVKAHVENEV